MVNALLRKKADTNIENADTLETCLHLACTTYRDDPDGGFRLSPQRDSLWRVEGPAERRVAHAAWAHPPQSHSKNPSGVSVGVLWIAVIVALWLELTRLVAERRGAGKMEYEDLIQDLVKAGAMAFPDRSGAYPDVGDDAVGLVANAAAAAEKKVRGAAVELPWSYRERERERERERVELPRLRQLSDNERVALRCGTWVT